MTFDQLAIWCRDQHEQEGIAKQWKVDVIDQVTAIGFNKHGALIKNTAALLFDHETIPGLEFELIRYIDGWNWLKDYLYSGTNPMPRISHLGTHLQSAEAMEEYRKLGPVLQEVVTVQHANPACADRRYHYVILDTCATHGACVKLIRRLTLAEADAMLQQFMQRWDGRWP